jgi:signal transduction histidine kinase
MQHWPRTRVGVRLRYGVRALELSIEDDGAAEAADVQLDGHGLRGMRERAAMLGGAFIIGPLDEGGYRVTAILPYGSEP